MWEREDCLALYQRLISLLEEDESSIAQVMSGDLYDAYKKLVQDERNNVINARNELRNKMV